MFEDFKYTKKEARDVNIGEFLPSPVYVPHEPTNSISEDLSYFLGMILSDGHITKNLKTIKVAVKKDVDHFNEKFVNGLKAIDCADKYTDFVNKRGDYTICLNRKSIVSHLVREFGLPPGNKSKIISA